MEGEGAWGQELLGEVTNVIEPAPSPRAQEKFNLDVTTAIVRNVLRLRFPGTAFKVELYRSHETYSMVMLVSFFARDGTMVGVKQFLDDMDPFTFQITDETITQIMLLT